MSDETNFMIEPFCVWSCRHRKRAPRDDFRGAHFQTTDHNALSRLLVAFPPARDLLDYAKHLFVAAMAVRGPSGWGAGGGPPGPLRRGLITALGPWEPPR